MADFGEGSPPRGELSPEEAQRARDPPMKKGRGRSVPVSRVGRAAALGGLALQLALGAVARAAQDRLQGQRRAPRALLSPRSAQRLVSALGRARGAALKVGQLLSMADSSLLSPELRAVLAQLQHRAQHMPPWQSRQVLEEDLGRGWRDELSEFEEFPFAAASLGQVHRGKLRKNSARVAIKVQFPGVAESIGSDIDNFLTLLRLTPGLPKGLFAEQSLRSLREELSLECDYGREAKNTERFRHLLSSDEFFRVPAVFAELSSRRVLCTELGHGETLGSCRGLPQDRRDQICSELLRLSLRELFEFRVLQSDPNWANFLYCPRENQVTLLDFGATREFDEEFTDLYIEVMRAAAEGDSERALQKCRELKFLTGYESQEVESAHAEALRLLGEPFRGSAPFDFGAQGTARGVGALLPRILRGRLAPPPEPSYALHRKLGGLFLACAHLGGRVRCGDIFWGVYEEYWRRKKSENLGKNQKSEVGKPEKSEVEKS